jgi:hypothetical protein
LWVYWLEAEWLHAWGEDLAWHIEDADWLLAGADCVSTTAFKLVLADSCPCPMMRSSEPIAFLVTFGIRIVLFSDFKSSLHKNPTVLPYSELLPRTVENEVQNHTGVGHIPCPHAFSVPPG